MVTIYTDAPGDVASLPQVRASIEAALIAAASGFGGALVGVAGTVIVGVTGYRNTRKATETTVSAAHSERVWDRKADAYQDALAAALWRNHRRIYLTTADLTEEQYAEAANALVQMQTEQDWWTMQGRLGTVGAPSVVQAYNASLLATEFAHRQHDEWRNARGHVQLDRLGRGTTAVGVDAKILAAAEMLTAFRSAMADALAADYVLESAIRRDLDPDSEELWPAAQVFTKLNTRALDGG